MATRTAAASASALALALAWAAPAGAACPQGEASPACETGHFAHVASNDRCVKVVNTDTGTEFGVELGSVPVGQPTGPDNTGILAGLGMEMSHSAGYFTARSTGVYTACGDVGSFWQLRAVRGANQ